MQVQLIAEIGLCHDGSFEKAKEMIRVARDCGATMVKGQAFNPADVKGSMPADFYEQRRLSIFQLVELIEYGLSIDIPVFFSIFSKEFEPLHAIQKWQKFAAVQSRQRPRWVESFDSNRVIVSVNPLTLLPQLRNAHVLYACPYLTDDPHLACIDFFTEFYGRQVGYSDHARGIDWCKRARFIHGAEIIEKHFTLSRDIYFRGVQFRDAIHGATPAQMEDLAKAIL